MMKLIQILLLSLPLAQSCAIARAAVPAHQGAEESPLDFVAFDPVRSDIHLAASADGPLLLRDLLTAYGEATGQMLVISPAARMTLMRTETDAVDLAKDQVQAFVASTLFLHQLTWSVTPGTSPRMIRVMAAGNNEPLPISPVSLADLAGLRLHAASRVSVRVPVSGSDARNMANNLRGLTNGIHANITACNDDLLIVSGFAPVVSDLISAIDEMRSKESAEAGKQESGSSFEVVALQFASAGDLANILSHMINNARAINNGQGNSRQGNDTTVVADPRTNSLLVRGSADSLGWILAAVKALDVEAK